jgi:hypothetical protein
MAVMASYHRQSDVLYGGDGVTIDAESVHDPTVMMYPSTSVRRTIRW